MNQTLAEVLEHRGWLTLSQFVKYVQEVAPIKALSYPAILRYVDKGILKVEKVGGQRRISKECIEHYLKHGVEVPFVPENVTPTLEPTSDDISSTDKDLGEEAQMPPTSSSNSIQEDSAIPRTSPNSEEYDTPRELVIPAIPESKAKRPFIPPPDDD